MQLSDQETLVDRAVANKTLYNILAKVIPENDEGVQQAYVEIDDDTIEIVDPSVDLPSTGFYGMDPSMTTIAKLDAPFPMIPRVPPADPLSGMFRRMQRNLLRQSLRKIVDEV